jgi:hypothetical protein
VASPQEPALALRKGGFCPSHHRSILGLRVRMGSSSLLWRAATSFAVMTAKLSQHSAAGLLLRQLEEPHQCSEYARHRKIARSRSFPRHSHWNIIPLEHQIKAGGNVGKGRILKCGYERADQLGIARQTCPRSCRMHVSYDSRCGVCSSGAALSVHRSWRRNGMDRFCNILWLPRLFRPLLRSCCGRCFAFVWSNLAGSY